MNNNTNEVVIIELQIGADSFEPFYEEFAQVDGLMELMYQHPNRTTPWPLLSELIENNTVRLFRLSLAVAIIASDKFSLLYFCVCTETDCISARRTRLRRWRMSRWLSRHLHVHV